jgi:hypothetical protein
MSRLLRHGGQLLVLAAIAGLIGAFSVWPVYTHRVPALADIRLSFTHGAPRADCRRLSADELAKLPRQMRRPVECPRERLPVTVLFQIDGNVVLEATLPPSGLSGDGPSRLYRVFPVSAGEHQLVLFLRDTNREAGYDYSFEQNVALAPGQNQVIDFSPAKGGFYLR